MQATTLPLPLSHQRIIVRLTLGADNDIVISIIMTIIIITIIIIVVVVMFIYNLPFSWQLKWGVHNMESNIWNAIERDANKLCSRTRTTEAENKANGKLPKATAAV